MIRTSVNGGGEVVLYAAPDGTVQLDVRLEKETVWLSLDQIAKLFGRDKSVISRHLRNVFSTRELDRASVVAKMQQLQPTEKPTRLNTSTWTRFYQSATG